VTLFTLIIFLLSIWSLAFYTNRMLRSDMAHLLADQLSSTVSYVAADLNREFEQRVLSIETIARSIDPSLLEHPATLQAMLASHFTFQTMFNAGVVVVTRDGTAVADFPMVAGRRGTNYASNVATQTTLSTGRSVIGRALIGRVLHEPLFNINAAIRDGQGKVIGALFGVINLAKPNFLDRIGEHHYGKSGGYLVIDPQLGLIVTATDKSRVLQTLPASGINDRIDQRKLGYLGSMIAVNSMGIEMMSSASRIPLSGWLVVAALPTEEAFAPIRDLQRRILWASILFTLLAGVISWWLLRLQFAPLLLAVKELATRSNSSRPPQPLSITRQDEIGELIAGFNRLLETLAQREEALKQGETFKNSILNSIPAEIAVLDRDGVIVAINEPWQRSLDDSSARGQPGGTPAVAGANFLTICKASVDATPGAKAQSVCKGIQTVLDGRARDFAVEYADNASAPARWFNLIVTTLEPGGQGAVLSRTNITERKQVEERISLLNRDFVSFLEHTSDFVYFKDEHHRFRFCSQTMATVTGHAGWRDLIGKGDQEVFPKETAQIYDEEDASIYREGKPLLNRIDPYFDIDGNKCWASTNKWPLFDHQEHGTVVGLFGISRDITEAKGASEALQVAKAEADRANQAKSRFLAAASHDLRQPLSALTLYVGVLKNQVTPESRSLVTKIQNCCDSLSELLTDLLDVSKLDAGVVTPKLSDFSINDFLSTLVAMHSAEATLKGVRLRLHCCGAVVARTDHQLLTRIVSNLIDNAIRYTNQGGVLLACRRHAGAQWIEVWDTGVGIPADKTQFVFEEFRQLEHASSGKGSGLGLAIVTKTAELLGLQIRLRSRPGRGSMFAIELPIGDSISVAESALNPPAAQRTRIGLVEDNVLVQEALVQALKTEGHEVIAARSAKELMQRLGQQAPDIIISDYRLRPGETGFEVIKAARAAFGEALPALIITGDTDPKLVRSMSKRGIAIQYKPLKMDALQAFVSHATKGRSS